MLEVFRNSEKEAFRPIELSLSNQVDFKDKNVLDVGFGRGEILKYCYDNGAKSCVGIDYSPASLRIASEYLKETNIKLYLLAVDELSRVKENDFEVVCIRRLMDENIYSRN